MSFYLTEVQVRIHRLKKMIQESDNLAEIESYREEAKYLLRKALSRYNQENVREKSPLDAESNSAFTAIVI